MKIGSKPLLALGLLIAVVFVLLVTPTKSKVNAFQTGVVSGSLEALAQDCLDHNRTSVTVPAYTLLYEGVGGVDEAVANYSVVLGHPLSKQSEILNSESQIIQGWYKFAITEVISSRPFDSCQECKPSPNPPSNLLPVAPGQLLIAKQGGSVVVNGVTINCIDEIFPDYQMSQTYLLFIRMDSLKGVGITSLGPAAAFTVDVNGALTTMAEGANNSLAQDITARYGNSLASLRAALHQ